VEKARAALAEVTPGSNVALSVNGVVIDREPLQAWWRQTYEAAMLERASIEVAECLISAVVGPILPTHPQDQAHGGFWPTGCGRVADVIR